MSFPQTIYADALSTPYTSSGTTKLYPLGTRLVLADGRVFRYACSSGACNAGQGVCFTDDEAVGYTTIKTTAAIGAETVEITAATHDALTKDELVGGYIIIYGAGGDEQFRGIVGNDASAANAAITGVKLDAPLVKAVTAASTGCELFYNPYARIATSTNVALSKAGIIACAQIAASGTYFWLQTWGPVWCAPQNASFADANDRAFYWRHDGSIEGEIANASKGAGTNSTQYGGFLITEGFTAGPLIMLQVCP